MFHGFLRAPDGTLTPVDVPGAGTGTYQGTYAAEYMYAFGGINPAGTITGYYADKNSVYHGFLRTARGQITTFDVLGAGAGNWQGTVSLNIAPDGATTGWYIDANGVYHGTRPLHSEPLPVGSMSEMAMLRQLQRWHRPSGTCNGTHF